MRLLTVLFLKSTGQDSYLTNMRRYRRMVRREMMMKMMIASPLSKVLTNFILLESISNNLTLKDNICLI